MGQDVSRLAASHPVRFCVRVSEPNCHNLSHHQRVVGVERVDSPVNHQQAQERDSAEDKEAPQFTSGVIEYDGRQPAFVGKHPLQTGPHLLHTCCVAKCAVDTRQLGRDMYDLQYWVEINQAWMRVFLSRITEEFCRRCCSSKLTLSCTSGRNYRDITCLRKSS